MSTHILFIVKKSLALYGKGEYSSIMAVNERVRQLRQALSMSQTDFSRAICVSNGYTAEIENGHRTANDRIIRLICLTFGVNESWLKTGEGEMFHSSPVEKRERILSLFNELNPQFQDYALTVIDRLLMLQHEKPI
jgi:transcriptional regulator with XRE-family HTH domain